MSDLDEPENQQDERPRRMGGGGSISMHDPRLSRFIGVGLVVFAGAVLAIGGWVGTTLVGLRESVATIVAQNAALITQLSRNDARDDIQDTRLSQAERDIATLEGRNLRGVPNGH